MDLLYFRKQANTSSFQCEAVSPARVTHDDASNGGCPVRLDVESSIKGKFQSKADFYTREFRVFDGKTQPSMRTAFIHSYAAAVYL